MIVKIQKGRRSLRRDREHHGVARRRYAGLLGLNRIRLSLCLGCLALPPMHCNYCSSAYRCSVSYDVYCSSSLLFLCVFSLLCEYHAKTKQEKTTKSRQ